MLYTFQTVPIISSMPFGMTDYLIMSPYSTLTLSYSFF